MKIFIPLLVYLCLSLFSIAQTWEQLPMHGGGYVTGLIHHPTDANTLFARIDVAGLYKTTNGGDDWISLSQDIIKDNNRNYQVRSFAIDETNPQRIFFVSGNSPYSEDAAFWKSIDGGTNWTRQTIPTKITGNQLARYAGETMAIRPNNPNDIYVAGQPSYNWGTSTWNTNGGFYHYDDATSNWTRLDGTIFDQSWVTSIQFHPTNNDLIYLAVLTHDQWGAASTNAGLWVYQISTGILTQIRTDEVMDFAFDAGQANTIIAMQSSGISWSYDAGQNWSTMVQPFGYSYSNFITAHPTESGHWFFGYWSGYNLNGIVETTDGGANFYDSKYNSGTNNSLLNYPLYATTNYRSGFANAPATLLFSPINQNVAYVSDWYGVWQTTDANTNLVANTAATSTDNAAWSWTWKTQGIHNLVNLRISKNGTRFYANVADIGAYYSDDLGATMHHMTGFPVTSIYKMQFQGNTGYCVGKHHSNKGRIVKTIDGGTNWFEVATGGQYNMSYFEINNASCITDIQLLESDVNTLIVGIEKGSMSNQIYRSDDGGVSYYAWDNGISTSGLFKTWTHRDKLIRDADGETFYVYHQDVGYKRHINDASWQAMNNPSGGGWFAQMITHPTIPNLIYATQYSNGIYKSTDGGQSWALLPANGLNNTYIAAIANRLVIVDGNDVNAMKPQNVFYSDDEGNTWTTLGTTNLHGMLNGITFISENRLLGWSENNSVASIDLPAILPVDLLFFTGINTSNGIELSWKTAIEINHDSWDIERSEDGVHFVKIVNKRGQGNSSIPQNYRYLDQTAKATTNYYRLRQNDINGSFQYSKVIVIDRKTTVQEPVIFSTTDGIVCRFPVLEIVDLWAISVYNLLGQLVYNRMDIVEQEFLINGLKGGVYVVNIKIDKQVFSQVIMTQ